MATKYSMPLQDTLLLANVLPGTGKIGTMKVFRRLVEALEPNADEKEQIGYYEVPLQCPQCRFELGPPAGQYRWNPHRARMTAKIVEISEAAKDELAKLLAKLEDREQLPVGLVDCYDVFAQNRKNERIRPVEDDEDKQSPDGAAEAVHEVTGPPGEE